MNSDEERQLFESWGWEYDYIKRRWVSPRTPTVVITTDDLAENVSPMFDHWLHGVVRLHGVHEQQGADGGK